MIESKEDNVSKIVSLILSSSFTESQTQQIVLALKFKGDIVNAVLPNTNESRTVKSFLLEFWDWEKSPYVKEKNIVGHNIHRRYVDTMLGRVRNYWIPRIGNFPLGTVTQSHIKKIMWELANQPQTISCHKTRKLAPETVNQICRAILCPLRWAYQNDIIKKDITLGISFCHVIGKKREILNLEQAQKVFNYNWKDNSHKLANLIAMCTGMRIGEVQALQEQDIALDLIHINHSWARKDGLKSPKNGFTREVKIPHYLYLLIKEKIQDNYFHCPGAFIFQSKEFDKPYNSRHWTESLHKVLTELNIPNRENICFHSWRHFFVTHMSNHVEENKLQVATGHKSQAMLEHYAAHKNELALNEIAVVQERLFSPIIKQCI